MKIDKLKSVSDIIGNDWGPPPPTSTFRLRERYELRRKPLRNLNFSNIELLLEIDFETDSMILVPYALNRLGNSFSKLDFEGLSLLKCVLKNRSYEWKNAVDEITKVRTACCNWLNVLNEELSIAEQTFNKLDFYQNSFDILSLQNSLLENLVEWERSLRGQYPFTV